VGGQGHWRWLVQARRRTAVWTAAGGCPEVADDVVERRSASGVRRQQWSLVLRTTSSLDELQEETDELAVHAFSTHHTTTVKHIQYCTTTTTSINPLKTYIFH